MFTSLGGKLVTVGEVWVTTEDPQTPWRLTFSLSLLHREGAQTLVVDFEVVSKLPQTFPKQIHNRKLPGNIARLGFPNKPKSNKQPNELEEESLLAWWKCRSRHPLSIPQRN
jgi:hypothetical protein